MTACKRGTLLLLTALAAPAAAAVVPAKATAQDYRVEQIERVGGSDVAVDRRLDRMLAADPLIITRDTMLAASDTIRRSVLVLDATLILEGVITGDLVLVDAGAFVRPESVVQGDLVNVGGGLYRSQLARIGGEILDLPLADYRVVRETDRLVIEASGESPLVLDEFSGFHPPTYDRVNGLTVTVGAAYRLPRLGDLTPWVHGQVGWITERGEPTYGADLRLEWAPMAVFGGFRKGWVTNDEWIRGDLMNSLNYLWDGDDFRDYHSAEQAWVGVSRAFGDEDKNLFGLLSVRGEIQDAESLYADEPWHLLGDSVRPNPAIEPGRTSSVIGRFEGEWLGLETALEGWVEYESAQDWLDGEFTFDRVSLGGDFAMHALADHTLEIEFYGQLPVSGGPLPPQRWSFVGGSGTLQTLEDAEFYGDHVTYVESKYIIPFPERVALPIIGAPELQLVHAAGMAWFEGDDRDIHQEIGARLQFFAVYVRYMIAPGSDRDPKFNVGVSWPFGGSYPWEQ